jgi:deoxyribodipyrimidine photo-lyase
LENKSLLNVFWLRRDLRLHDNHGLYQALSQGLEVLPIFIFDKNILSKLSDPHDTRVNFIYKALCHLNTLLEPHNASVQVYYGEPLSVFENLCQKHHINTVYTNQDYEPNAIARDSSVAMFLQKKGVLFKSYKDQVIFEKNEILKANGNPYTVFTPYSKVWKAHLLAKGLATYPSETLLHRIIKNKPQPMPSLQQMGFVANGAVFESPVLVRKTIENYAQTRNYPATQGTTKLSVHLRFGTGSVRILVKNALNLSETWLNELIWREFFMMILYQHPKVENNCFKKKYENIAWRNHEPDYDKWCQGQTGYALVDAGIRELNSTGFMHNRVRMVVASFLCKHLLIDWRWGQAYFSQKLLDYDLSANNGNWQWAAGCGCDAAPYFRVFNPNEQQRKFDPKFDYIKTWIPNYQPNYLPALVEHNFARQRALEVYRKGLAPS